MSEPAPEYTGVEGLTYREDEVMAWVCSGMSNKQIGWRLDISSHTVKFHVRNACAKLGAPNRIAAAVTFTRHFCGCAQETTACGR